MSSPQQFDKPYQPADIEQKWYGVWEKRGYFSADSKSDKPPFVIMMPPPNITGALHLGHALTAVIQDVLIRWKRMQGFNALWLPGTDHAGIATQNVVEKELVKEGTTRHELGREKFIERVWEWREQYGRTIMQQQKRFGVSCDWGRERFTMGEMLSRAVREVFVSLYEEGLIYRGNYLINWCPRCESALSDLEVTHVEKQGKMWSLSYPLEDGSGSITVATTRPETMLGDTAVAVHPEDKRYKGLVGKMIKLPLTDRTIPIIADDYVDPEFGSGAVKITPAHDFNDFEVGKRHGLETISVLDSKGKMNKEAGVYKGLDRFKARKKIVADLKVHLVGEAEYKTSIGHCSRCDTVVEPYLSMQWFVKTKPLAQPAIEAVRSGKVKIVPEGWGKTYYNWMENIKDWCISRQIWWGHRIPAWYCKSCSEVTVSKVDPTTCAHCKGTQISQDTDVLDTWFSSGLWPFSTLGWPDETADVKAFYPSTVMETGFDILFFWVARMMMMGIHFMKKPPFEYIYLHAMVRDEKGHKMSKSRGNVIDPLDLMNEFGADALRFTLATLATPGRDVKLKKERIQGYRNFINKVWNATRFSLMNMDENVSTEVPDIKKINKTDRWILTKLQKTIEIVQKQLEGYRLDEAAQTLYHFTWKEFCDWYVELAKPLLKDPKQKSVTQQTLLYVLKEVIRLLHPYVPFATEEMWQALPGKKSESVMMADYPTVNKELIDEKAEQEMEQMMAVVSHIRNIRGEHGISPAKKLHATVVSNDKSVLKMIEEERQSIEMLAKLEDLKVASEVSDTKEMVTGTVGFADVLIPMTELFDVKDEKKRLEKEISKLKQDFESIQKRLSNKSFMERAPKEVVAKDKARATELEQQSKRLQSTLQKLGKQ